MSYIGKIVRLAAVGVVAAGLGGCVGAAAGAGGVAALATLAGASQSVVTGITLLSDAAQTACDGQKAANDLTNIATMKGWVNIASVTTSVSNALGKGCVW